jgi:hypothetical protein
MPRSKHRRKAGGKAIAHPGHTPASQALALRPWMWRALGEMVGRCAYLELVRCSGLVSDDPGLVGIQDGAA